MSAREKRWLFFTAGLGTAEFESSAFRLASQAASFKIFDTVKVFTTDEVMLLCSRLSEWYPEQDLSEIKGFGWYTWKSKLADLVVRDQILGRYDGYMYLDSGCEMFLSVLSKRRLIRMMEQAGATGATLFTIPTPEVWHTKKDVLELFMNADVFALSNQFQSGSWLLNDSETSKSLVNRWESLAAISPQMTDESLSKSGEYPEFRVHRYDQAIFSMVCKELGLSPSKHVIPGSTQSWKYLTRAFSYPFWWSRNRTGGSVVPRFMMEIGKFSLKASGPP